MRLSNDCEHNTASTSGHGQGTYRDPPALGEGALSSAAARLQFRGVPAVLLNFSPPPSSSLPLASPSSSLSSPFVGVLPKHTLKGCGKPCSAPYPANRRSVSPQGSLSQGALGRGAPPCSPPDTSPPREAVQLVSGRQGQVTVQQACPKFS